MLASSFYIVRIIIERKQLYLIPLIPLKVNDIKENT